MQMVWQSMELHAWLNKAKLVKARVLRSERQGSDVLNLDRQLGACAFNDRVNSLTQAVFEPGT